MHCYFCAHCSHTARTNYLYSQHNVQFEYQEYKVTAALKIGLVNSLVLYFGKYNVRIIYGFFIFPKTLWWNLSDTDECEL